MSRYRQGDYVKVEFVDEASDESEWMWVRVHRCDDERALVFGVLDNTPVNDASGKLNVGTELAISFDRVREYKRTF